MEKTNSLPVVIFVSADRFDDCDNDDDNNSGNNNDNNNTI